MSNWKTEIVKWDEAVEGTGPRMRIHEYKGAAAEGEWANTVIQTKGTTRREMNAEGQSFETVVAIRRTANVIILVSSMSVRRMMNTYPQTGAEKLRGFAPGIVIMDEFHKYKGSHNSDTLPFDVMYSTLANEGYPVLLVYLFGTLLEEGIDHRLGKHASSTARETRPRDRRSGAR